MELNTRCPNCETMFAVALEQLQLRKGYIRCIQCAHIFDGFEAVVPAGTKPPAGASAGTKAEAAVPAGTRAQGTVAPVSRFSESKLPESKLPESRLPERRVAAAGGAGPAAEPRIPPAPQAAAGRSAPPAGDRFFIPPPDQSPVQGRASTRPFSIGGGQAAADGEPAFRTPTLGGQVTDAALQREPQISPARGHAAVLHDHAATPAYVSAGRDAGDAGPDDGPDNDQTDDALYMEPRAGHRSRGRPELFDGPQRRRGGWLTMLWGALAVCGLLTLLAQGAYVYRAQLANAFVQLRPVLESACGRIGCAVPYERRIEAIAVTGSALRSSAAVQDDVSSLVLEVTLRNTYERPQEWPTLVLDLKDASGAVVVRRNLPPETWVPAQLRDGPFAAGSEIIVQVPVSVRGLQANGYQLDKFFP